MAHRKVTAAVIQMNSGKNKESNLARAESLIVQAAAQRAKIVVLPEMFNWRGPIKDIDKQAEPIPGPTIIKLSRIALSLNIHILAGSIAEKTSVTKKAFNTSILLSNRGRIIARYRKLHLFKFRLDTGKVVNEENFLLPGDRISFARLNAELFGLSICFDLRFPELYRALANHGCTVFCVPSAFTYETGSLHWEVLLRSRAIENQAYILAPNQYGLNPLGFRDYGHSMIIGPRGEVLSAAADTEAIVTAELDFDYLNKVRGQMPVLKQVMDGVYKTTG